MSNKNLLNENTVRRFMKLAEIEPLTNQFVDKINESDYKKDKKHGKEDDKVEEAMHGKEDDKVEEAMHGEEDGKFEFEEGMYSDDDGDADFVADIMEEDYDGPIDEDLENFLAELDMQDDEEEMPEMGAEEEVDLDVEEPDAAPAMGGIDPAELGEMVKDAVMDALKQLVDDGDLDVSMGSETEEIDVEGEDAPDEDEEMVNEVARRVLKRIVNSRR